VKKFSTNLFIAVSAFLIGLASASAFHYEGSKEKTNSMFSAQSDVMGNICANQD
jgi:hypothetical protein